MPHLKTVPGIAICLFILVGCTSDFEVEFKEFSYSKALQQARSKDKMVLVNFYSPT